jgi:hypothetical protein
MRRILLLIFWQFGLLAGGRLFADVVTLKDGRQISGLVESGNTQELHIKVGDQSQTIDIHQAQAIQFGVSLPAPAAAAPTRKAGAAAQADTLILKDGTHVTGRWWSIDAGHVHILVNNQLPHYPRPGVSAVTFGNATLPPPPPARSTPPSATSAQPPASAAQPARAPTLARPSGSAPPSARPRAVSRNRRKPGRSTFGTAEFLPRSNAIKPSSVEAAPADPVSTRPSGWHCDMAG